MNLTAILGVLEFDLRRQATIPRIVSFIGLASFRRSCCTSCRSSMDLVGYQKSSACCSAF